VVKTFVNLNLAECEPPRPQSGAEEMRIAGIELDLEIWSPGKILQLKTLAFPGVLCG